MSASGAENWLTFALLPSRIGQQQRKTGFSPPYLPRKNLGFAPIQHQFSTQLAKGLHIERRRISLALTMGLHYGEGEGFDLMMKLKSLGALGAAAVLVGLGAVAPSAPLAAQSSGPSDYRNVVANNMRSCAPGGGPSIRVTINGIKAASGKIRAQVYNGTSADWLEKGKWLNRIEMPARRGRMTLCLPVPKSGNYAVAVRHDVNGNGKTDIRTDGGAMSNDPSINIFNLGKPGIDKTRFTVGRGVKSIAITMKYFA